MLHQSAWGGSTAVPEVGQPEDHTGAQCHHQRHYQHRIQTEAHKRVAYNATAGVATRDSLQIFMYGWSASIIARY